MSLTNEGDGEEEMGEGRSGGGCYWVNAAGFPTETQRTVIVTGVARGGTSFVASAFGRLGVPHTRGTRDKVSGHWEHVDLRTAFKANDEAEFARIVSEFNEAHDIWAWKLPSMRSDLDMILRHVRNPCFVFPFKEVLSMAMRKISLGKTPDVSRHFTRIFNDYTKMVEFAADTDRPTMLVSYDKALRRMEECLDAFARFAGVEHYDFSLVKAGIEEDARRY